jgi:DNA polymerase IV
MNYLHIDMDAFFASVEQMDQPAYRGLPLIVGAEPGTRGVVCAASYEARSFGVRSAMPISHAVKLCPQGVYVRPRMSRYLEISQNIMLILAGFSPHLIQVSIDEAFLDIRGTARLLGPPDQLVAKIRQAVAAKWPLSFSVGLAENKLLAKMASARHKPAGFTQVELGQGINFINTIPFNKVWGLGDRTLEKLGAYGIKNHDALRQASNQELSGILGKHGASWVQQIIRGIDPGIYEGDAENHSLSRAITFAEDQLNKEYFDDVLFQLSCELQSALKIEHLHSRVLQVKYRTANFNTYSVQKTYTDSIDTIEDTWALARALFYSRYQCREPLRLLGLAFAKLETQSSQQGLLFDDLQHKRQAVEQAVVALNGKYNPGLLRKGRSLL